MARKGRRRGPLLIGALAALVIVAALAALYFSGILRPRADERLTVHFIDVGQGEATVITCGGQALMIDGGGSGASQTIYHYLKKTLGLKRIDYMISTHPHADHAGGLSAALNACDVGAIYSPVTQVDEENRPFESLLKYAALQNLTLKVPAPGDSFTLGGAVVTFLGPLKPSANMNDMSLVARVSYGRVSMLFVGDAEAGEESDLLGSGMPLDSDVLKVGHHGSATSTGEAFLNAVSPSVALIGLGAGNAHGHPAASVISRLEEIGAAVYRTDLHGDIVLTCDGETMSVSTAKTPKNPVTPVPEITPSPAPAEVPTRPPAATPGAERTARPSETPAGEGTTGPPDRTTPEPSIVPANPAAPAVPAEPAGPAYIGNSNSHKFHYPDCSSVGDMKEKNKVPLSSREEAVAQGYEPCGRCKP